MSKRFYRWDKAPKARELLSDLRGDLLAYAMFGVLVDYAASRQSNRVLVSRKSLRDAVSGGNPSNRPSDKKIRVRLDKFERDGLIRRPSPDQRKRDGWTKGKYEVELLYLPIAGQSSGAEGGVEKGRKGRGRKRTRAKVSARVVPNRGQQDLERQERLSTGPPPKGRPVETRRPNHESDALLRESRAEWERKQPAQPGDSRRPRPEPHASPQAAPQPARVGKDYDCELARLVEQRNGTLLKGGPDPSTVAGDKRDAGRADFLASFDALARAREGRNGGTV